jgi:hypothetical protein
LVNDFSGLVHASVLPLALCEYDITFGFKNSLFLLDVFGLICQELSSGCFHSLCGGFCFMIFITLQLQKIGSFVPYECRY